MFIQKPPTREGRWLHFYHHSLYISVESSPQSQCCLLCRAAMVYRLKNSHFLNLSCFSCKKIAFFFTFVSQFVNTFVPLIHQQNRHGRAECSIVRAFSCVHANDMLPFGAPIGLLSSRACSAVLYIFSIFAAE